MPHAKKNLDTTEVWEAQLSFPLEAAELGGTARVREGETYQRETNRKFIHSRCTGLSSGVDVAGYIAQLEGDELADELGM